MAGNDNLEDTGSYDLVDEEEDEALPVPATAAVAAAPLPALNACAVCKTPLVNQYYMMGTAKLCPNCTATAGGAAPGGFVRFLKATALGILGGLLGAAVWYGFEVATGKYFGLIAVLVGFLVGYGVMIGSGRRGGRGYQFLAIGIAYLAIAVACIPMVYKELDKASQERQNHQTTNGQPAKIDPGLRKIIVAVIAVPIALLAPILNGFDNPISLLFVGIAFFEAWKINRRKTSFVGPFTLAASPPGFSPLPPPIRR